MVFSVIMTIFSIHLTRHIPPDCFYLGHAFPLVAALLTDVGVMPLGAIVGHVWKGLFFFAGLAYWHVISIDLSLLCSIFGK